MRLDEYLPANILTVHPDPLVRAGMLAYLRQHGAFDVFEDVPDRVNWDGSRFDVVIADDRQAMRLTGAALRGTAESLANARILVLASDDREADVRRALEAGIHGAARALRQKQGAEAARDFEPGEGNPIAVRPRVSKAERAAARVARRPEGTEAARELKPGEGDPEPDPRARVPREEREVADAARGAKMHRANKAGEIPSCGENCSGKSRSCARQAP